MNELKSAWLMVTSKCNLKCKYCWATSNYGGRERESMSQETAFKAMDFIVDNGREGIDITFFGGEPLIEFDLIKDIMIKYPQMSYGLYTNTTLFNDSMIDFFYDRRDFIKIVLSIDGTQETNLACRGFTYDENTLSKVLSKFPTSSVRYTLYSPKGCYEGAKRLYELGANKIAVNVAHFINFDDNYFEDLDKEEKKIRADYFLSAATKIYSDKERNFCKAGKEYVAIDPRGDLYPCDLFYWLGKNKIGDINSGIDKKELARYLKQEDGIKERCSSCIAEQLYRYG